ncbi:MAG: hypothetical protein R3C61_04225 [Bacteroidia bacterium]
MDTIMHKISLVLVFILGTSFICIHAQERALRFVIASFQVDGANADLVRRLRSDFDNQLFDIVDQCSEQLEFIPDAQGDAIDYLVSINERYKIEFGITAERVPIPKRGNFIVFVRFEPSNSGTYLQIGIFSRTSQGLTYVGNGVAESEVGINSLYSMANRREFIQKALSNAISTQRLNTWIAQMTNGKADMINCKGKVDDGPREKSTSSPECDCLDKGLEITKLQKADCSKGNGYGTLCYNNQTNGDIKVVTSRPGYNPVSTLIVHSGQTECVYGLQPIVQNVDIFKNPSDIRTKENRTIKVDTCLSKTITIR